MTVEPGIATLGAREEPIIVALADGWFGTASLFSVLLAAGFAMGVPSACCACATGAAPDPAVIVRAWDKIINITSRIVNAGCCLLRLWRWTMRITGDSYQLVSFVMLIHNSVAARQDPPVVDDALCAAKRVVCCKMQSHIVGV
jgi:hypothetical protein